VGPAAETAIPWDLCPFILLNLCLSCLAAVQGIILRTQGNTETMKQQSEEILTCRSSR
jgi:uncharacterized membrane protein